ncbi:Gfo/Idh/MocA family protein [Coralloluteibacterium thermophilus]|uniref:Gfo/Idh/MocA family protein n=1 Tax=Coralloluteibacterium thermophilum TaxID=2707049 RepID=A0ABV9NP01_9GAMM
MSAVAPLRLGFLGVGWIGRHRMQALLDAGLAEAVAIADPDAACMEEALKAAPGAIRCTGLDDMLAHPLDGVVIATPSAAHAVQSIAVLERGLPVFCQKPLGRDGAEVRAVVEAARRADRRLGVDLSYRHLAGMDSVHALLREGALGDVHGVQLVFHNAYGPGKDWFYDRAQAGGGCVIDLGIHLIDLALWLLGNPTVEHVSSRCFARGRPLRETPDAVEDYASARLDLAGGAAIDMSCSWNLPIGIDCEIGMRIYGTRGGVGLRNVDGSFYDFVIERFDGRQRQQLAGPPDAWGGRAALAWAEAVRRDRGFDASADGLVEVAEILDRIYGSEQSEV